MRTLAFILATLIVTVPCIGETIIVDPNGSADYINIQNAINASWDGDIIEVQPGTYSENVYFNGRAITLTSEDPNDPNIVESTIITAVSGSLVVFNAGEDGNSVVTGFTISSGDNGILCISTSPTIKNNIINNCGNGGIYGQEGAMPFITNNIISGNSGTGIYDCDGRISNNTIAGNTATFISGAAYGGGLVYCDGEISDNIITGNNATVISGNDAYGGGLYNCDGEISNNTITDNNATARDNAYGGGLANCGGTLSSNTISNNTAIGEYKNARGGGLYNCGGTISSNTITGNTATANGDDDSDVRGGGLYYCNGDISSNTISNNTATANGDDAYGGGLAISQIVGTSYWEKIRQLTNAIKEKQKIKDLP